MNEPRKRSLLQATLVKLAHGSAPFLSTFLLIHLSAPVLANVGGSSWSSSVMLLGREYYQTPFGEKYLLLTPFVVHVTSAIARRVLFLGTAIASKYQDKDQHSDEQSPLPASAPRKLTSALCLAAYASLFIFLPIHVFTHRLAPADPSPPIFAVGPAELDYEFVKVALRTFPWRSWALYAGLVASVSVHAVEGAQVLRTTLLRGIPRLSSQTRKIVAASATLPVLLGLWTLSKEPLLALSSTAERYAACFSSLWVYRI